jgi:hypothetical protein
MLTKNPEPVRPGLMLILQIAVEVELIFAIGIGRPLSEMKIS